MARLKGFYFSLDALTASTVMIAVAGLLITYNQPGTVSNQNIDSLHTSAKQNYSDWNQTSQNQKKVLTEIYSRYYSGNQSSTKKLCQNYFKQKNFALYFQNQSERHKACGKLKPTTANSLKSSQTLVSDIKINKTFIGPKKAVMVVNN